MRATGFEVYVRQAEPNNFLTVLTDIKTREIYNIIIDIQPINMGNFLNIVSKKINHLASLIIAIEQLEK